MPDQFIRFTEADKHRAAAAIFKQRHPNWEYSLGVDVWAYDYACAALAAVERGNGND